MPYGFGSTGVLDQSQDTPPEKPKHNQKQLEELTEAIHQWILQQANQPQPQAPTPPSFQGFQSPWTAAAGALNPQALPLLMQKEMGPAQSQYAQQQAAFEAAMQGKQQALGAGVQLIGQERRAEATMNRPTRPLRPLVERNVELQPNGQYHLVIRYKDPNDPTQLLAEDDRGPARSGFNYQIDNEGNIIQLPSQGAPASASGTPTGLKGKQPETPGTKVAGGMATLDALKSLKGVWSTYNKSARLPAIVQGAIDYGLQSFPGTTRTLVPERDYTNQAQFKSEIDNAVLRYVNSLSGKQYTMVELEKFRQLFPFSFDDEATVDRKMMALRDAVLRDVQATQQQFPQTQVGAPPADLDSEFDAYMRNRPRQ